MIHEKDTGKLWFNKRRVELIHESWSTIYEYNIHNIVAYMSFSFNLKTVLKMIKCKIIYFITSNKLDNRLSKCRIYQVSKKLKFFSYHNDVIPKLIFLQKWNFKHYSDPINQRVYKLSYMYFSICSCLVVNLRRNNLYFRQKYVYSEHLLVVDFLSNMGAM